MSRVKRAEKELVIPRIDIKEALTIDNLAQTLKEKGEEMYISPRSIINNIIPELTKAAEEKSHKKRIGLFGREEAEVLDTVDICDIACEVFREYIVPDSFGMHEYKIFPPLDRAMGKVKRLCSHLFVKKRGTGNDLTIYPLKPEDIRYFTQEIVNNMSEHYNGIRRFEEETREYRKDVKTRDRGLEIILSIIDECMHGLSESSEALEKAGYYASHLGEHLRIWKEELDKRFEKLENAYGGAVIAYQRMEEELEKYIINELLPSLGYERKGQRFVKLA